MNPLTNRYPLMELSKCTFDDVLLGGVFFDPESGQKFQKVSSDSKIGEPNARGNSLKTFDLDDEVKAHESRIIKKDN